MRYPSFVDDPLAPLVIDLASLGQFDTPRRAIDQAQPDGLFEHRDAPR